MQYVVCHHLRKRELMLLIQQTNVLSKEWFALGHTVAQHSVQNRMSDSKICRGSRSTYWVRNEWLPIF